MAISIEITTQKPKKIYSVNAHMGKITIGDYSESIYVPLDFWSVEDYKKQWKEGLERLKTHDRSCLVATIHDPSIRPLVDMWVMYKVDNMVYVQNERYMADMYDKYIGKKCFDHKTCYDFITPRINFTEDGDKISEWSVTWPEFVAGMQDYVHT